MLTLAVCDDEARMVKALAGLVSEYLAEKGLDFKLEAFADGRALLESAAVFDVVFLDVRMPPPDGMETARLLRARGYSGLLIFTTVLTETVFDAFEVRAFDYLVKPLEEGRFRRAMDRALGELSLNTQARLLLGHKGTQTVVALSELVYCEVQGRRLYLYRSDGTVLEQSGRLEEFARRLDARFFRCHRSYLVNLDHVRGCAPGRVALLSGGELPVSRLRERELKQALLRHMSKP